MARALEGKERFRSRGYELCKFIRRKGGIHIRKMFNSHWIGLVQQHGCSIGTPIWLP